MQQQQPISMVQLPPLTQEGDSIIISSSTHTDASTKVTAGAQEDYSNIEKYYDARAGLQNIITNTVYSKANAAACSIYWSNCIY